MHTLKFGAAADDTSDINDLRFVLLQTALDYWCDNMIVQENQQNVQTDDVKFLQVGDAAMTTAALNLKVSAIDSRGYSFTVTNPDNFNQTRNNGTGQYFNFNSYRAANIYLNRMCFNASSNTGSWSGTQTFYILYGLNNSYHVSMGDTYAVHIYNCAMVFGTTAGTNYYVYVNNDDTINIKMMNNAISVRGYLYLHGVRVLENNTLVTNQGIVPISGLVTARNNIIFQNSYNVTFNPSVAPDEWKYNVYNGAVGNNIAGIDPSRIGLAVGAVFADVMPEDQPAAGAYLALGADDMHTGIKNITPRRAAFAGVTPPEPRVENPLRYYINGADFQAPWCGEQYGAAAYNQQKFTEVTDLVVTPQGNLTMRLDWTIPLAGVPGNFTKWGIYKRNGTPPVDLQSFVSVATRIGEVPINAATFTDNGGILTNVLGGQTSYRVRAEV
jgi:hypothetical protein